jgi:hypothetical protein
MECTATLNMHLIKLESGKEILQLGIPFPSAHCNHKITSFADLLSHKPLPEIEAKVDKLVRYSHLNQMSLMLALKDWINHELIPQHLHQ